MNLKIQKLLSGNGLTFLITLAVVTIMPVHVNYLPPFMILWGLTWLWENNFSIKKGMFLDNKVSILFLMFIGFYLWQISGLIFADSIGTGIERIVKRLSFLLFPLVLFYPGEKIIKNINYIIKVFAICTFIFIVYCFAHALYNSISIVSGNYVFNPHPADYDYENFFYSLRLSDPVHPSYLSMYIVLSILISLESVFDNSLKLLKRFLWSALILIYLFVLYLLSSRAGMLSAIVVLPLYFLFKLTTKFPKWVIIFSIIAMVLIFLRVAWTNDKVYYDRDGVTKSQPNEIFKKDVRYNIWKSAIAVIKKNPVLGVGTGDATEELKKEYLSHGYTEGYYDNLNAHNQFIEILLENGIIGLIIFLGILGYMMFLAVSTRNLIYGLFIIMMIIFFFFESSLNRLAGVTFFPLFTFLLIFIKPPDNIIPNT